MITFDPTASGNFGPTALSPPLSSNLPASYNPFTYTQDNNKILIGDNCTSTNCFANKGTDTAFLFFSVDALGNPSTSGTFAGVASTSNTSFSFSSTSLTVTLAPTTTPLPAALPLFAAGLGGLGLLGWRRKRKVAAEAAA
jgi:hypothetical protein